MPYVPTPRPPQPRPQLQAQPQPQQPARPKTYTLFHPEALTTFPDADADGNLEYRAWLEEIEEERLMRPAEPGTLGGFLDNVPEECLERCFSHGWLIYLPDGPLIGDALSAEVEATVNALIAKLMKASDA